MSSTLPGGAASFLNLYRVVRSNPATGRDFLSFRALGIPPRHRTAKGLASGVALSVYRTREQAASLSGRSPWLGGFVAEIRVPTEGRFKLELDDGKDGHCTIWGEPQELLAPVVSITPA